MHLINTYSKANYLVKCDLINRERPLSIHGISKIKRVSITADLKKALDTSLDFVNSRALFELKVFIFIYLLIGSVPKICVNKLLGFSSSKKFKENKDQFSLLLGVSETRPSSIFSLLSALSATGKSFGCAKSSNVSAFCQGSFDVIVSDMLLFKELNELLNLGVDFKDLSLRVTFRLQGCFGNTEAVKLYPFFRS